MNIIDSETWLKLAIKEMDYTYNREKNCVFLSPFISRLFGRCENKEIALIASSSESLLKDSFSRLLSSYIEKPKAARVAVISIGCGLAELGLRAFSVLLKIAYDDLYKGNIDDYGWTKITSYVSSFHELNCHLVSEPVIESSELVAFLNDITSLKKPDVVMIFGIENVYTSNDSYQEIFDHLRVCFDAARPPCIAFLNYAHSYVNNGISKNECIMSSKEIFKHIAFISEQSDGEALYEVIKAPYASTGRMYLEKDCNNEAIQG